MTLRKQLFRSNKLLTVTLSGILASGAVCQTAPASAASDPAPPPVAPSSKALSPEMQGDLLAARQHYVDAIAEYRLAPQDSATVANKIGVAYHHMFAIADAKRYYERAIHLNPSYAEAINNLGAIYHAEKNYKQAERLYRKAIKIDPHAPLFYSNLGTAYFFEGNLKKGAEAYGKAFAMDPGIFEGSSASRVEESSPSKDLALVNYVLAKTYAQAGKNDRALVYLRKAMGEGFSDRRKLMNDPELASLRVTPEFAQILAMQRNQ